MTISSKLVDIGGLAFAVSDDTDTIDVLGFSDQITSGAVTAKFSGGATMQAPSGFRIGTTQIKIIAGTETLSPLALGSAGSDWADGANIVDGDLFTESGSLSSILPTVMEVVVDYGSIASRSIGAKFNILQPGNLATSLFTRMTSRIFISDTEVFGAELDNQVNTVPGTNTGAQNADFFHNVVGPNSFRFVKFTLEQETTNVPSGQRAGSCFVYSVNLALQPTSAATINIRASDTQNTADGTILDGGLSIIPNSTTTLSTELLLVPSLKFLTLDYAVLAANTFVINLSQITSITEV